MHTSTTAEVGAAVERVLGLAGGGETDDAKMLVTVVTRLGKLAFERHKKGDDPTLIFTTFLHKSATKIQRQVKVLQFRDRLEKHMTAQSMVRMQKYNAARRI